MKQGRQRVWMLDAPGLPVRTFPEGRLCQHADCGTYLSIYNEDSYCGRHQLPVTIRMRGVAVTRGPVERRRRDRVSAA